MARKRRKSDLASLAQQRQGNTRSAIVNPRLIPAKVARPLINLLDQEHSTIAEAIDKAREKCACFPPNAQGECPTFGVGNSQYTIQPR